MTTVLTPPSPRREKLWAMAHMPSLVTFNDRPGQTKQEVVAELRRRAAAAP